MAFWDWLKAQSRRNVEDSNLLDDDTSDDSTDGSDVDSVDSVDSNDSSND